MVVRTYRSREHATWASVGLKEDRIALPKVKMMSSLWIREEQNH